MSIGNIPHEIPDLRNDIIFDASRAAGEFPAYDVQAGATAEVLSSSPRLMIGSLIVGRLRAQLGAGAAETYAGHSSYEGE